MDTRILYNIVRITAQAYYHHDKCYAKLSALLDQVKHQCPVTTQEAIDQVNTLIAKDQLFDDVAWQHILKQPL